MEHKILHAGNLGSFYKYINSKLSCKSGMGPIQEASGNLIPDDLHKANLMNDFFASMWIPDDGLSPPFRATLPDNHQPLNEITFSQQSTCKHLLKLKGSLASGSDNLPPLFFKTLAVNLASAVTMLNRRIFATGELPVMWKSGFVTPIFKKGCSSDPCNYRPITLTCVSCKIFETAIKEQVLKYMIANNLINAKQHGFIGGYSTCTNLLESVNDWTINLKNRSCTRVAFIHFKRAFDSVCFNKLISKLSKYGIGGNLICNQIVFI